MYHWVGGGKKRLSLRINQMISTKKVCHNNHNFNPSQINLHARTDDQLLRVFYYRDQIEIMQQSIMMKSNQKTQLLKQQTDISKNLITLVIKKNENQIKQQNLSESSQQKDDSCKSMNDQFIKLKQFKKSNNLK